MTDDIVTRLRRHDHDWLPDTHALCDLCDACYEIERLRRWKSEATTVIENWEAVWEAAGSPGVLGQLKSLGLLGELGRLDDEIERLRAALHLAAGLLSSCAPYDQMHPDRVLELLADERDHDHHEST